ncbi:MAG: hypothetical protein L0H64_22020 [Pseudonocardia sp.]|nr:hypothetical protein [Pseudonocardia sp.]
MTTARVAGNVFDFSVSDVERAVAELDPEPIREHYVVVGRRRYPPKQVLAAMTRLDRADFTTHQARSILVRLGFGVHRRGHEVPRPRDPAMADWPHGGAEAAALAPYKGRFVAQDGLEVLYDSDSPYDVARWLRKNGLRARVWKVPATAEDAGSFNTW